MPAVPKITSDVVTQVLERIAKGETLERIARDMGFHRSAWFQLTQRDEAVRVAYARAKEDGCETMIEECLAIADRRPDAIITTDADGNVIGSRIDSGYVAWAKNRIETRLKLLATWNPEKYGTKAQQGTTVNVNVVSNEQVTRVAQELRLLRQEAREVL